MAKGCQHEPAVETVALGIHLQAPDVGQAEHIPHKVSTAMERQWLGLVASHLTRLTNLPLRRGWATRATKCMLQGNTFAWLPQVPVTGSICPAPQSSCLLSGTPQYASCLSPNYSTLLT